MKGKQESVVRSQSLGDTLERGHRDLVVGQKAMRLVKEVCRVTRDFPKEETYRLTNQLRRAAVSVSSRAEGHDRFSRKEFRHFVGHARGSLLEVETQLEIAQDLGYLNGRNGDELLAETSEIARLLNGLRAGQKEPLIPNTRNVAHDYWLLTPDS